MPRGKSFEQYLAKLVEREPWLAQELEGAGRVSRATALGRLRGLGLQRGSDAEPPE